MASSCYRRLGRAGDLDANVEWFRSDERLGSGLWLSVLAFASQLFSRRWSFRAVLHGDSRTRRCGAITSGVRNMQQVMNLVWDKLLPAMKPGRLHENASARRQLQARLASLAVKFPGGTASSPHLRTCLESGSSFLKTIVASRQCHLISTQPRQLSPYEQPRVKHR